MSTSTFPNAFEEWCKRRPRRESQGLLFHHDSVSTHITTATLDFLVRNSENLVIQPPYLPDLTPHGCFLFSFIKQQLLTGGTVVDP